MSYELRHRIIMIRWISPENKGRVTYFLGQNLVLHRGKGVGIAGRNTVQVKFGGVLLKCPILCQLFDSLKGNGP